jgi:hypothetical protein
VKKGTKWTLFGGAGQTRQYLTGLWETLPFKMQSVVYDVCKHGQRAGHTPLIDELIAKGKKVAVPVVKGSKWSSVYKLALRPCKREFRDT